MLKLISNKFVAFFSALVNGFKSDLNVYKFILKNPAILIYPALSGCAMYLLIYHSNHIIVNVMSIKSDKAEISSALVILAFYLPVYLLYVICLFCNVAGFFAIDSILRKDKKISLPTSLAMACKKLPQILIWAFINSTIGMVLKLLEFLEDKTPLPYIGVAFLGYPGRRRYFLSSR